MKAEQLRTNQLFVLRLSKRRGVVLDVKRVKSDPGNGVTFKSAPRVMLVGATGGVIHKTLHPDVEVDVVE